MSIKDSFNSALIKSRPYTLDFGFMTDALNFLIYKNSKYFHIALKQFTFMIIKTHIKLLKAFIHKGIN